MHTSVRLDHPVIPIRTDPKRTEEGHQVDRQKAICERFGNIVYSLDWHAVDG